MTDLDILPLPLPDEGPDSLEYIGRAIASKFEATGFPTEEQVALTLTQDNWWVTRNARYRTKKDPRYHEVDIIAEKKPIPRSDTRIVLVIECKKQEEFPWIFAVDSTRITNHFAVTIAAKEVSFDVLYASIEREFERHYYYNSIASTVHISPYYVWGNKKDKELDPIREAIYQTLNHWFEIYELELNVAKEATPSLSYLYPVIVLNGRLVTYSVNGEVKEVDRVPYLIEYLPSEPVPLSGKLHARKPVVIDVVTLRHFKNYLQLVQTKGIL